MENFNLDELMDLAEAYVGPMVRCDLSSADRTRLRSGGPRGGHVADRPDQHLGARQPWGPPTEVLLMAAYGERGVLDRPNMRVMR